MPYSLTQTVWDGPLAGPRWAHHGIRALLALAVFVGLLCLHVEPVFAGFSATFGVHAIAVAKETLWPSDPQHYSFFLHATDFLTDLACACVALVAGLVIAHGLDATTVYVLVGIATVYAFAHHGARP